MDEQQLLEALGEINIESDTALEIAKLYFDYKYMSMFFTPIIVFSVFFCIGLFIFLIAKYGD